MKRIIFLMVIGALLLGLIFGCNGEEPPPEPGEEADTVIDSGKVSGDTTIHDTVDESKEEKPDTR